MKLKLIADIHISPLTVRALQKSERNTAGSDKTAECKQRNSRSLSTGLRCLLMQLF